MKFMFLNIFIAISLFASAANPGSTGNEWIPKDPSRITCQLEGTDTIFLFHLKDIFVLGQAKNAMTEAQEEFYWKTVRDVKRILPFAKIIGSEYKRVNKLLENKTEPERKKFLASYEKEIYKKYGGELKGMSINQGKLLLKLIDRECDATSYDLIKTYRGNFSAFFWQSMASIFGATLKSDFESQGNDRIVEKVINLVEAGQL